MPATANNDIYDGTRTLGGANLSEADLVQDEVWDKNRNILIIGPADTAYSLGSPAYESDIRKVRKKYGPHSVLTACFETAQSFGAQCIFLLNIQSRTDFLNLADIINQHDFAYIVPIGILMSDSFFDFSTGREMTYIARLMSSLRRHSESVFVVTDKHASLYEDIDAFIDGMNGAEKKFLSNSGPANRENLIFVANNLEGTEYSNLYAAVALAVTEPNEYPQLDFGDALFAIDQFDMTGSWAYFKSHFLLMSSIENFLNEYDRGYPQKIAFVSRIMKIIKREIEFNEFCGRQYTDYQRFLIGEKLERYLEAMMDFLIVGYEINSVVAYKDTDHPGTVTIVARFRVQPVGTTESVQIEKEVEIGI